MLDGRTTSSSAKLSSATLAAQVRRHALCVFPRYARSFATFHHAYPLMPGIRACMPPQGLLVIAASIPKSWEVRFVDENVTPATDADFEWADVVFITGMHVQRDCMRDVNDRAHRLGKVTVLGGPSVSACPEWYPDFDILHVGELGDATQELYAHLNRTVARPTEQMRLTTRDRTPLREFPTPAYHLADTGRYFLATVQFSSGCPFRCEFCDIPELYGRKPRLKTPEQVCSELDAIVAAGGPPGVYFVDDNFIGNPRATLELLPHLINWQRRNGYRARFVCEATINIVRNKKVLELMREAFFQQIFLGIESPDEEALRRMDKSHNFTVMPILDAIATINSYGIEVVSGIIMGLDQDTPETADRILAFIEASQIPMLTINMLYALPKTPLWRRLESEGRILSDGAGGEESNVRFLLPRDAIRASWLRCVVAAYTPEALYGRFEYQLERTYPHRFDPGQYRKVHRADVVRGFAILARLLWRVGIRSDYRRTFWTLARRALRQGNVEAVVHVGLVAHHLIQFARDCQAGIGEYSFYAPDVPTTQRRPSLRKTVAASGSRAAAG